MTSVQDSYSQYDLTYPLTAMKMTCYMHCLCSYSPYVHASAPIIRQHSVDYTRQCRQTITKTWNLHMRQLKHGESTNHIRTRHYQYTTCTNMHIHNINQMRNKSTQTQTRAEHTHTWTKSTKHKYNSTQTDSDTTWTQHVHNFLDKLGHT